MQIDIPTLVAVVILIIISSLLSKRLDRLERSVKWILEHVHVVPNAQANDPEMIGIKKTFGIEEVDNKVK